MRKYVVVVLRKGPIRDLPEDEAIALQTAHLRNIGKIAEDGKLVFAGPFFGEGDLRGIYVFNFESLAESETLTNLDPTAQAGSLVMELKEWHCSAALMAVIDMHKTLAKVSITE